MPAQIILRVHALRAGHLYGFKLHIVIPAGEATISLSGLAVASLVGIILNAILPGKDYEFGVDEQGDTSVNFKV